MKRQWSTSRRYAWMAYAAICIMSVVWVGIQFNCLNLYAAPVVEDLGITRTQFMVTLSIPAVISATVSLLCFGLIEERLGIRRMLLVGGILNTLAFVCWFLMDSTSLLYVGAALYGCGCSITAYNSVAAGVNRWFKKRTGSLMGAANAMGNVAGIVFALVIAALIATVGWRYSFGICVFLSAAATVACVALYKGNPGDLGVSALYEDIDSGICDESQDELAPSDSITPPDAQLKSKLAKPDGIPFRAAIAMPRLWLLALGYLLVGTTTYGLMSTLPLFAVDLGFGQLQGQAVSASLCAAAVMMVPLGMICDRFGTRWALALCCLLTVVAAVMLRVPDLPLAGVLVAAACSGAAYSACGVCVGTGVKEAFGDVDYSKKLGLCSGFSYIGLAIGPALINLVYDTVGSYAPALLAFVALGVATALLFFVELR